MDPELLNKLLEYIDAKVDEYAQRHSSDGGLVETVRVGKIREELEALAHAMNQ